MTRKGITPIIAIIILLLIVVALAGLASQYLFGFLQTQIADSFIIQPSGVFCDNVSGGTWTNGWHNQITVVITNTGQNTITADAFVVKTIVGPVLGENNITTDLPTTPVPIGEPATIVSDCNVTEVGGVNHPNGCDSGVNTIHLATGAGSYSPTVNCP